MLRFLWACRHLLNIPVIGCISSTAYVMSRGGKKPNAKGEQ